MTANQRGMTRTMLLVAAALVVAALLVAWVMTGRRAAEPSATEAAAAQPEGTVALTPAAAREAGLTTEPARVVVRRASLEAPGLVALDERRTARIGSQVEGKVLEVFVEIGDRVAAGRELAHMISPVVHDSWAAYRRAVAERRRAQSQLELAVQGDERAKRLLAARAISEQDARRAAVDRVAAEESLNIANTEVRRAEEEMEHLGITNAEDPSGEEGEQIPVRAPLAGVVLEKLVTEGSAATPGTPLFVVSDLSSLWVLAEIDETAVPHVRSGSPVEVRVAAYPAATFAGTIAWVADIVNPKTRRITVRCAVPNHDGRLKPDMYATVRLGEGAERQVVVVPSAAVQDIDGKAVVFVQGGGATTFVRRAVTTGEARDGTIEVLSGLQAGERVVVAGAFLVKSELLKSRTAEE